MIQVIERAFNILEFIASQEEKYISLTKISLGVDLHKATCSNILKTMVKRNYLEKSEDQKGYGLGFMYNILSGNNNDMLHYTLKAKDAIKDLRDCVGEGCLLAIIRGETRVNICKINTSKELRIIINNQKLAYKTSSGRMILASLTKEKLDRYIQEFGLPSKKEWPEIEDKKSLLSHLDKINNQGFCIRKSPEGIIGYSVPIKGPNALIFSIAVFVPSIRWNDETENKIKKEIKNTARNIEISFNS